MNIGDRAVLVRLRIESWGTTTKDDTANEVVADAMHSRPDATYVAKRLVPPDALKAVKAKADAARAYVRSVTQPWSDEGDRLLAATKVFEVQDTLRREYRPAWQAEVDKLVARLPEFRDVWGPKALGAMYNPNLYPTETELRRRFVWKLDVLPLNPNSKELRVILGDEYVAQVEAEARERLVQQLCERIAEPVARMLKRLRDPEAKFRDSLVENVREMARLIPALNLTGHPALAQMAERLETELAACEPETLRESPAARASTAAKAQNILDTLAAIGAGEIAPLPVPDEQAQLLVPAPPPPPPPTLPPPPPAPKISTLPTNGRSVALRYWHARH